MSAFRDRTFAQRFKSLGDEAEGIFKRCYPFAAERYGLERPKINMRRLPAFIRYTPDFLCHDHLVEVQGCGRKQTWAFKLEKVEALNLWQRVYPVRWFLYENVGDRYAVVTHDWVVDAVADAIAAGGIQSFEDNGKEYVDLGVESVDPALWTAVDADL